MSTKKKNKIIWFLERREKIYIGATIIILLVIFFLAVLLGYSWGFSKGKKIASTASQKSSLSVNNKSANGIPLPPAPLAIYAYSGKVTAVEGKTISLATTVQENNQMVDKIIKVTISDKTACSQLDISKPPLPPNTNQKQEEREKTINCSEIQPENNIVAYASENVKDKTEFTATKVKVLISGF